VLIELVTTECRPPEQQPRALRFAGAKIIDALDLEGLMHFVLWCSRHASSKRPARTDRERAPLQAADPRDALVARDLDGRVEDLRLEWNGGREIWEKFVFLVGLSATTATMRVPIGPIREDPQTRAFLLDVMREVVAVGRAHEVPLPEDYAEQRLSFADGVAPDMTSSMHHDLERGKPLEVRWLSGGVVQLAREVGIETPLNRAVADILCLRASGQDVR